MASSRGIRTAVAELAPDDWQQQVVAGLKRSTEPGNNEALRLLGMEGANLSSERYKNDALNSARPTGIPARRPVAAAEPLTQLCAYHGRARVLRELTEQGVDLLAASICDRFTPAVVAAQRASSSS